MFQKVSGHFDEINLTKSKIQQIFVAISTIQQNISILFQIFRQIVLRQKYFVKFVRCQI